MKKQLFFIIITLAISSGTFAQGLPSYVPTSGLLAWYSFTGNANDNSGNGYNGVVHSATLTTDRFGNANSAYLFDGTSSNITTFLRPPTGNAARTITCWFKYNSLPDPCGDAGQCIVGYGANNRSCTQQCKNFSLEFIYGPPKASVDGVCIATRESSPIDTLDNTWHFYAAVYDPSYGDFHNVKIYIDGIFITTSTVVYGSSTAVATDTLSHLDIGAGHYSCQRFFDGKIDDIGVWNRALSLTDLDRLYHTVPTAGSDSFAVYTNDNCAGVQYEVITNSYTPGKHVKTFFGNGKMLDTTISAYGVQGICNFTNTYASSGEYTIKHILYNGSAPVDSVTYSHNFRLCNSILVNYYNDINSDCAYDPNADMLICTPTLTEVDSNNIPIDTISSLGGLYYTAYGTTDDVYSFKTIAHSAAIAPSCPPSGIITDTLQPASGEANTKYIGMACNTGASYYDLSLTARVNATGTNDQSGDIFIQNNTSCVPVNAMLTLYFTPKFIPQYGATYNMHPIPDIVNSNSVSWNLPALATNGATPIDIWYAIYHSPVTGYLAIGDTVHSYYTITPLSGDLDTSNNNVLKVETVKAGCDPNEMWVSPEGCIPVSSGITQLEYTVTFENTGNDTAFNIYVIDTLSDYTDPSSMRMKMSAAPMNISKFKNAAGKTIVKFDFPRINLLDSTHHGQCSKTFIFTINTKPGLANGTVIENEAGIYFDYNNVVMTNQVVNVIGCPVTNISDVKTSIFNIYPNPANDLLNIKMSPGAFNACTITNNIGQVLIQQQLNSTLTKLNIKSLPPGLYYVTARGDKGTKVQKFVKL